MSDRLKFSPESRREIAVALAITLQKFGERKYDEYRSLIAAAIDEMLRDPFGPLSKTRDDLTPGARMIHISRRGRRARHIFIYRVMDNDDINVSRFLYDGMDLAQQMRKANELTSTEDDVEFS